MEDRTRMKPLDNVGTQVGGGGADGAPSAGRAADAVNAGPARTVSDAPDGRALWASAPELLALPRRGRWASFLDAPALFRLRDIVVSLACLVLAAPLMGLIALLIRLDSPGPAIFRQRRVGRQRWHESGQTNGNGQGEIETFLFCKFRTMYVDAWERFPELYRYEYTPAEIESLVFKLADDPRLTRVGWWLRRASLDELPNFINVLKGDMSLVGPRPDIPEMLRYYRDWQKTKFLAKPGITGYAQTNGRALLGFQRTLREDVLYVLERSFLNDLRVLVKTVWVTVKRIGAF